MKVLILMKQRQVPAMLPPNQYVALLQAAKVWHKTAMENGSTDFTYSVVPNASGISGVGVGNVKSAEETLQMLYTYPLYPLFDWEIIPLGDTMANLDAVTALYKKMAG